MDETTRSGLKREREKERDTRTQPRRKTKKELRRDRERGNVRSKQKNTQERGKDTQVVCSNKVDQNRLAESDGTPAMDPGHRNIDLT